MDPMLDFTGKVALISGGTGFLGKTWLSMLLTHYPQIGHVWLMVRPRKDQDSEARFWADVAPAGVFDALQTRKDDSGTSILRIKQRGESGRRPRGTIESKRGPSGQRQWRPV